VGNSFTQQARGLLYMAASAAAVRLERLVGDDVKRVGSRACLTPREQAVVRHASIGMTMQQTANALGLGEETVRSHFKKAQAKLGTRNRTHTVAEAMRELLIVKPGPTNRATGSFWSPARGLGAGQPNSGEAV
jgi:DNA-binding CsgD family transcriptional regulator